MTACKDSLSGKKAVSATLAGVLAVGMVPAAAFAATDAQADTTGEDGIALLTADQVAAFNAGTVTAWTVNGTNTSDTTFKANGNAVKFVPTAVTLPAKDSNNSEIVVSTTNTDNFKVTYKAADEKGKPTGSEIDAPTLPGKYVAMVNAIKGDYAGASVYKAFDITAADLDTVGVYEVNPEDAANFSDHDFYFTGSELNIGFYDTATPKKLVEGTDYTVKVLKKGTDNVPSAQGVSVKEVGEYVAYVTGQGIYAGQTKEVQFKVKDFPFTADDVVVADVTASETAPVNPTKVYDEATNTELDPTLVKLAFVSGPNGSKLFDKPGAYSFSAIYGSATENVTVNKVQDAAAFGYDDGAWNDTFSTNLGDKDAKVFDATKIVVKDAAGKTVDLSKGWYTLDIQKDGYGKYTNTELVDPGTYTVTVTVNPAATGYTLGGSATCKVTVKAGTVNADADVYVTYQDKVVTSVEQTYAPNTTITAGDFKITAKDADGNDVSSAVTATLYNADGTEATNVATDAGSYTLKLTSDNYVLTGTTEIPVTINKLSLENVKIKDTKTDTQKFDKTNNTVTFVKTGETIDNDAIEYVSGKDSNGNPTYTALPDSAVAKVTVKDKDGKEVTGALEEGAYTFEVTAADKAAAKNYAFPAEPISFNVTTKANVKFADNAEPGAWFFGEVNAATSKGFMHGYDGTSLFGPNDTITRGQVAVVLFNMAITYGDETAASYNNDKGYKSFDDVDGGMYYAQAIAWAKATGVVTGYNETTFGPNDNVTREQFATMLARYAEKFNGGYEAGSASDLAEYGDASVVDAWATEYVAWAVNDGLMGKNTDVLNPLASITRAEAAAMVVRYAG